MFFRVILLIVLTSGSLSMAVPQVETHRTSSYDGLVVISNHYDDTGQISQAGYLMGNQWYSLETPAQFNSSSAFSISGDGMVIAGNVGVNIPFTPRERSAVSWNYSSVSDSYAMQILNTPAGYDNSRVYNMSDNGDYIVGYLPEVSAAIEPACYWDRQGDIHLLGSVSSDDYISVAYDVSDNGIIVGTEIDYDVIPQYAIIWDEEHGVRDLKDVLVNDYGYDFDDWLLSDAVYINPEGTYLVGNGFDPDGNNIVWEATIPEPATLLLFGIGAVLLRVRRRV